MGAPGLRQSFGLPEMPAFWSAGNACFLRRKPVRCDIYCCACLPGPLQEMMAPMLELLQGENVAAARAALGRLGCWADQGQNGGRVSLSSLKHTLGQLNLVTVLTSKDAHEPVSFRCNCSAFVRDAQCVHEDFCASHLGEGSKDSTSHTLKHFTAKRLPDIYPDTPASGSGGSHAGGRPLNLRGSAWSTVSQLQSKAAKATAKKFASASLDTA